MTVSYWYRDHTGTPVIFIHLQYRLRSRDYLFLGLSSTNILLYLQQQQTTTKTEKNINSLREGGGEKGGHSSSLASSYGSILLPCRETACHLHRIRVGLLSFWPDGAQTSLQVSQQSSCATTPAPPQFSSGPRLADSRNTEFDHRPDLSLLLDQNFNHQRRLAGSNTKDDVDRLGCDVGISVEYTRWKWNSNQGA